MSKTFNYNDTLGMIKSTCLYYVTNGEILKYFERFEEDKDFTVEEIKAIARELTDGKPRRKQAYPPSIWPVRNKKAKVEEERDR